MVLPISPKAGLVTLCLISNIVPRVRKINRTNKQQQTNDFACEHIINGYSPLLKKKEIS